MSYKTRDGNFRYRFTAVGGTNGNSGIVDYANSIKEVCETSRAYGAFPHSDLIIQENEKIVATFKRK